jgi:hypothetical protein
MTGCVHPSLPVAATGPRSHRRLPSRPALPSGLRALHHRPTHIAFEAAKGNKKHYPIGIDADARPDRAAPIAFPAAKGNKKHYPIGIYPRPTAREKAKKIGMRTNDSIRSG